jgi:molybdenum cofactor guanylyltransferase
MGRDKALLPYADTVLVRQVAGIVKQATDLVTLIGPPEDYAELGYPVIPDLRPGLGPLAGIEAALANTRTEWNLVVACDMPRITQELLTAAIRRTVDTRADCIVPLSAGGRQEPLCAMWRQGCLGAVRESLNQSRNAIKDLLKGLDVEFWQPSGDGWSENLNTPEDWQRHTGG